MKTLSKTAYFTALGTGLFLLFIGYRFFTVPAVAAMDFGIDLGPTDHFELHNIKAMRDFCIGVLSLVLLFTKEYRSLGWLMLCMAPVPANDLRLVLENPHHPAAAIYPHLAALIVCLALGVYYLYATRKSVVYAL